MKLDTPIGKIPTIGPVYLSRLRRLGIESISDLIYHVPRRYVDFSQIGEIARVKEKETVTLSGQIVAIKNIYTRTGKRIQEAILSDGEDSILLIWFNQTYLIKSLPAGTFLSISGRVGEWNRKKALISPQYEKLFDKKETIHTGKLISIYPETAGLSSKWLRHKISLVLPTTLTEIKDPLNKTHLKNLGLQPLIPSIKEIHQPKSIQSAEQARIRLAFDELLDIQLKTLKRKNTWKENSVSKILVINKPSVEKFINSLPFTLTKSQDRSVKEILKDMSENVPMNRLLEGDVGSGKTIVAAIAALVCFENGYQTAIMAPTQILAEQHYHTIRDVFKKYKVRVELITSGVKKSEMGKADIIIGTHALIHKKAKLNDVGLVIIDEQHRFGVEQRTHLIQKSGKKSIAPHVLTMTATPIPRTIALTVYGDLDLSTLDELPKGRLPITTKIVRKNKKQVAYKWINEQIIEKKIQAFVICPLIEESQKETMKQVKAATAEFENLKKIFPKLKLELLHGKLKSKEKTMAIQNFKNGKTNILVSTPVVEVGIDVKNAAIMIIETPERFGLAQLHQLRGRIGRGEKKSYCLLFPENLSQKSVRRLYALKNNESGHKLAELDLKMRGPGEIYGKRQSGFVDLKIATWNDTALIKKAREFAKKVLDNPTKYPGYRVKTLIN